MSWSCLRAVAVASALAGCSSSSEPVVASPSARAAIASGTVRDWPEAMAHLRFEVGYGSVIAEIGEPRPSGLSAFWSIATTAPGAGFFYADSIRGTSETRVAYAADAQDVHDIRDATALSFTRDSVGPVPVGGIVVIEHAPDRRYLAIVLDAIKPTDPRTAGAGPYAHADVTWYLTEPDQASFANAP